MSAEDFKPLVGRTITVKSRKLNKPVTGLLRTILCGALIIYAELGIYGIYAHDVTEMINEV
jgi:Glu-tRNA(Gln) amidotransferase subunit E-like FAD-binding protein